MKNNKKFKMKRLFIGLMVLSLAFTSCEEFLDEYSTIGLSADKLTDINAMNSLNAGAYNDMRGFYAYQHMITTTLMRDVAIRRSANWTPFYKWTNSGIPGMFTSNSYSNGYRALNKINTVLNADIDNMYGSNAEKASAKGDAFFLRAAVYFQLNNYFTHPTTGKSVPLVLTVLGTNDRVSLASSDEIKSQIESDIEAARTNLAIGEGITSHAAATAMAARIYFYHGKYDLAYERANEVISSGKFSLEANVADIYTKGSGSSEVIYAVIHNSSEQTFGPAQIGFNNHQADDQLGTTSLNPNGLIGQLRTADPTDKRFADLMSEGDGRVYLGGKWPTNSVDYVALRLAEMHLTRAEANIMVNNAVTADDVADVNALISRAGAATTVAGTPTKTEMLEIIFNERSKELYNEWGDRFLNTRRLQKGIVNENGSGQISHATYSQILYYPLPINEVEIHNLQ
jgi:hypothetical protein